MRLTTVLMSLALGAALPAEARAGCAETLAAGPELWVEPADAAMAVIEPDCYAWRLFVALNWPADPVLRAADPAVALGTPGPVVWETWRNARVGSPDAAFMADGSDPGPWMPPAPIPEVRDIASFDPEALQQALLNGPFALEFDGPASMAGGNETRMNKPAYEFIRSNRLYNLEGQIALALRGTPGIAFPQAAKEIKAQWRQIEEADKPRFHWVEVRDPATGGTQLFGLTALHITTKDLPNWFWATFEHIDNKDQRWPFSEGWLLPSVDRYACAQPPHDCDRAPAFLAGTPWENYVLRGSQIDFIDSTGVATRLANSQPEAGFQLESSCITCHARASIGPDGERLRVFPAQVGPPNPAWFRDPATGVRMTQLDFVFSLERACPATPSTICRFGCPCQ